MEIALWEGGCACQCKETGVIRDSLWICDSLEIKVVLVKVIFTSAVRFTDWVWIGFAKEMMVRIKEIMMSFIIYFFE